MASASAAFKSREDHKKAQDLEEARKAGLVPAERDEDGKEINPHIPQYMSAAPWYLNAQHPSLKHQKNWKADVAKPKEWYDRGTFTHQATTFRKGACTNCGAMTHSVKFCVERPRKVGAKWTEKHIAPDEKIQEFDLDYAGKRDRWNGYDASAYAQVVESFERRAAARKKFQKEQQLKRLAEKGEGEGEEAEEEKDEARVDESEQRDFARVEKRVRTTGGGSTGTVRNLRIREDTAKYLLNLDPNSAYYDPKTRSMREDPSPQAQDKFYHGDNHSRNSGQTKELQQLLVHAWNANERGHSEIHVQGAPSQAELAFREFKAHKEHLHRATKAGIEAKYGNAADGEALPDELLLGQTEKQILYDRAGRTLPGQSIAIPQSRYDEDVLENNHKAVWGSWWSAGKWGYACCHQTLRASYCTGEAGIKAAAAVAAGTS